MRGPPLRLTPWPASGSLEVACRLPQPLPSSAFVAKLSYDRYDMQPGSRTLRVVEVRDDHAEQPPVLVVEDLAGWRLSSGRQGGFGFPFEASPG